MVSKAQYTGALVDVFASKGPLAGSKVSIPDSEVDAATGEGGWAIKIEPGAQLLADPGAAYDTSWKIPGYTAEMLEPFSGAKPTSDKSGDDASDTQQSESSSKTSAAPTASSKAAADADNGKSKK